MDTQELIRDYHRWLTFQRQAKLEREHNAALRELEKARVSATRMTEAYRSMAEKAASEGACYRTLFLREREGQALTCEGWLFVRRVLAEGGMTRVRATLLPTFTLEDGLLNPGDLPAEKLTLEIFEQLKVDKGMASMARVDRVDSSGDTQFITLLDSARGDLRPHLK
ncbi:hypothetical protein [Halomonas caseinilytica]|uniref:Uncharacterized protein n=1 Tax=Halomonas caseinilytica TaxID=438744 RepID=A0A1M6NU07_9GAMM|nr:hypothetical protein [Halomonas caseinilytica]SEM26634.1 hypothetical protein SAMN04487952_102299 [Halomonas caseinilytica]SHJ99183.1 hypothetical protein SAMN05192556_101515 [Halomonas caseinilytica]